MIYKSPWVDLVFKKPFAGWKCLFKLYWKMVLGIYLFYEDVKLGA